MWRPEAEADLVHPCARMQVDLECALLDGRQSFNRPATCSLSDISSLYSFRPITADLGRGPATTVLAEERSVARVQLPASASAHEDARPCSAPSMSASALAKERIEMLEAELHRARQERTQMEASVRSLAAEMA
jgi:hypothetical protein